MSEFIILDVGHGNCAILRDSGVAVVVDAPTGGLLLDTLDDLGIDTVHSAFISHADKDHIAGILSLLTSERIKVERIFVNPDAAKRTVIWRDFLAAVSVAHRSGTCVVKTSVSSTEPGTVKVGNVSIDVVAPSPSLALAGAGGETSDGRKITSNTLSAVLRVSENGAEAVLLAGDLDEIGLDDATAHGADLSASLLVFPHHGGLPGGDPKAFAMKLIGCVRPDSVIFSNGRYRHDNPRQEIVSATVSVGCSVACTQLSDRCNPGPIEGERSDLENVRAIGRPGKCCGGSMTIDLAAGARRPDEATKRHAEFISESVATPMCR
jgi:beta-lactamase superfamily II metal-dependent hydrolase